MLLDDYKNSKGRSISATNLRIPRYDDDADSIGFVDIEEIKKINTRYRRRTVVEVSPPVPLTSPVRGFGSLVAWLNKRRETSTRKKCCYSNPVEEYNPKMSVMSSVPLPLTPPKRKRRSVARRLQGFLICFQH